MVVFGIIIVYTECVEILGGGKGSHRSAPLSKIERVKKMSVDDLVRLHVRVSKENNEFLEKKSAATGISKSALVQIAVEQYRAQEQAVAAMNNMQAMYDELNNIRRELAVIKNRTV